MTKHDELTEKEFSSYKPLKQSVEQLYAYLAERGLTEGQVRVLDWGCGRGRFVLWLREKGFKAYGVDVDTEPLENGLPLFRAKGYQDDPLSVLDDNGRCIYDDGFFHFVFTDNVLEHVENINRVAGEISRVTADGGGGFHIFPAHRQPVEGHLFMPLVHWFAAGALRRWLIRCFVQLKVEPHWEELRGSKPKDKADTYFRYSKNHLYYRHYALVKQVFTGQGFKVEYTTINNPKVRKNPLSRMLLSTPFTRAILNRLLLTFKQVELVMRKTN